jgi:Uncharacterized conserved protein
MKNFIQSGEILEVTAPYDVSSGDGVLVGSIFGFAVTSAVSGQPVNVKRKGVFEHAKTSAQAWTQGAAIYWDNTNKVLTTTASGNTLVGAAALPAANPSAVGRIVI